MLPISLRDLEEHPKSIPASTDACHFFPGGLFVWLSLGGVVVVFWSLPSLRSPGGLYIKVTFVWSTGGVLLSLGGVPVVVVAVTSWSPRDLLVVSRWSRSGLLVISYVVLGSWWSINGRMVS